MGSMGHADDLLQARISKLERQVEFLMRINGLDLSSLRTVSDEDLLKCYQDAVQLIGIGASKIPPEAIERWGELFLQISEIEVVRLQGIVEYHHTWEPFYLLCTMCLTAVRHHKEFGADIGLQQLYALLDRGRRNLRETAVIICKLHPEDLPDRARILLEGDGPLQAV